MADTSIGSKSSDIRSLSDMFGGAMRPSAKLGRISQINLEIVKELVEVAKKAQIDGNSAVANKILDSIKDILNNNNNLLEVANEIKTKID